MVWCMYVGLCVCLSFVSIIYIGFIFNPSTELQSLTATNQRRTYTNILSPSFMGKIQVPEIQYTYYRFVWANPKSSGVTSNSGHPCKFLTMGHNSIKRESVGVTQEKSWKCRCDLLHFNHILCINDYTIFLVKTYLFPIWFIFLSNRIEK